MQSARHGTTARAPLFSQLERGLSYSRRTGVVGVVLGGLDFAGEADPFKKPDAQVVDVELVPLEAVARGDRMRMVVVVPAFTTGDEGDPPVVARVIAGLEAAGSPHVGCGVDEPGGVETERGAQEDPPQDAGPAADEVERYCGNGERNPVIFAEPLVE